MNSETAKQADKLIRDLERLQEEINTLSQARKFRFFVYTGDGAPINCVAVESNIDFATDSNIIGDFEKIIVKLLNEKLDIKRMIKDQLLQLIKES